MNRGDAIIREVAAEDAEAVLTLRLMIPGVIEGAEEEYYLARIVPPEPVVESVTVNPDGSITETGYLEGFGGEVAHCIRADGRTESGRGFGYGKTVAISGLSADTVAVRVSMYWTDRNGGRGQFTEKLSVRWSKAARRTVGEGWIEARIAPR